MTTTWLRGADLGPRRLPLLFALGILLLGLAACAGRRPPESRSLPPKPEDPDPSHSGIGLLEVEVPHNPVRQRFPISVGEARIQVEISDHTRERRLGLAFRSELPEDAGMLFMYSVDSNAPFAMKDCKIGLDIAFIDNTYKIISISSLDAPVPGTTEYAVTTAADNEHYGFVLEMSKGWFARHRIARGDRLNLSDELKVRAGHAER